MISKPLFTYINNKYIDYKLFYAAITVDIVNIIDR
jgi:hypothetical protein